MKSPHLPDFLLKHLPWNENSHTLWPVSSFTLRRNLSKRPFPSKLSETEAFQVLNLIKSALLNTEILKGAHLIELKDLEKQERHYLFEHFFFSEEARDDANNQAMIFDESCQLIAGINLSDHLSLHAIDSTGDWHATVEKVYAIENAFSDSLEFAFSPRFGYLSSTPSKCGIALSIKAYLHLPALLQSSTVENNIFELESHDEYLKVSQMTSLDDDDCEGAFYGDLVVLENRFNLGVSEDQMLRSLYSTANRLINQESTLRSEIKSKEHGEFKDLVSRSFGILKHSYQMPTKDAISALSFVKLGIDLGWIKGITDDSINKIFFKSRRAHLLFKEENELSKEELLHKRSSFIHDEIKDAELTI